MRKIRRVGDLCHVFLTIKIVFLPEILKMSVIIILLFISLFVALLFLGAFLWSVKTGQFEDDYTPSVRILFDDEISKNKQ